MTNKKAIEVGNIFAITDVDNKLVGVELGFNANVNNREGVAEIITNLTASCHSTKWVVNNVMRWNNKDAQAEGNRSEDSSDDHVDAEPEGKVGDSQAD